MLCATREIVNGRGDWFKRVIDATVVEVAPGGTIPKVVACHSFEVQVGQDILAGSHRYIESEIGIVGHVFGMVDTNSACSGVLISSCLSATEGIVNSRTNFEKMPYCPIPVDGLRGK